MNFVMRLNNPTNEWTLIRRNGEARRLRCVGVCTKSGANKVSGPPEHQYLRRSRIQIWSYRYGALMQESTNYPIATATETTVETYPFIDRFGAELGMLNRENLSMQLLTGDVLQC